MPYVRSASHAGSWYPAAADALVSLFDEWLSKVPAVAAEAGKTRALACICPHAGYRFSGPTAAHSFAALRDALARDASVRRIFVLGPSHKVALSGLALASGASACAIPLGALRVDSGAVGQLKRALPPPLSREMTRAEDEAEHSIEMQLPFLAHAAARARGPSWADTIEIVPIMVGRLSGRAGGGSVGDAVASALAPWLDDPANFFLLSSDFCHYGERFDFEPFHEAAAAAASASGSAAGAAVADRIEALDREGMALIEAGDAAAFDGYIERTGNTICGHNPISLFLRAVAMAPSCRGSAVTKFVAYAQSSRAIMPEDSSVSYAAAVVNVDRA